MSNSHSYHTRTNVSASAIKSVELSAAVDHFYAPDPNYNLIYCKLCNLTLSATECIAVYRHIEEEHDKEVERISQRWSTPHTPLTEWKDAIFQRLQDWKITERSVIETKYYLIKEWEKTGVTPIAHPLADPYPSPKTGRRCRFCPALIVGQLRTHMIARHGKKYDLGMPISEMDGGHASVQKLDHRYRIRVVHWRSPKDGLPLAKDKAGGKKSVSWASPLAVASAERRKGSNIGGGDSDGSDDREDGDYTPEPHWKRRRTTATAAPRASPVLASATDATPCPTPTPNPTPAPRPVAETTTVTTRTTSASDLMEVDDLVVVQGLLDAAGEAQAISTGKSLLPPISGDTKDEPRLTCEAVAAFKALPITAPAHYYAAAVHFPILIDESILDTQAVQQAIRSDLIRLVTSGDLSDAAAIVYFGCKYPQVPDYFARAVIAELRTPPVEPAKVKPRVVELIIIDD